MIASFEGQKVHVFYQMIASLKGRKLHLSVQILKSITWKNHENLHKDFKKKFYVPDFMTKIVLEFFFSNKSLT